MSRFSICHALPPPATNPYVAFYVTPKKRTLTATTGQKDSNLYRQLHDGSAQRAQTNTPSDVLRMLHGRPYQVRTESCLARNPQYSGPYSLGLSGRTLGRTVDQLHPRRSHIDPPFLAGVWVGPPNFRRRSPKAVKANRPRNSEDWVRISKAGHPQPNIYRNFRKTNLTYPCPHIF